MKKLLILAVMCMVMHFSSRAQKASFGITAGAALSNYSIKIGGETFTDDSRTGFTAGVFADLPVGAHLSIQPAINFVQKGTKDKETFEGTTYNDQINVNCLEVPLNFLYNSRTQGGNFFVGLGPSFTYSLSGKMKSDDGTTSESANIKFGNTEDDDMRRFDFGANFAVGYQLNCGLLFSFNYNAGFSNLLPQGMDGASMKSHYAGLKVGYAFK